MAAHGAKLLPRALKRELRRAALAERSRMHLAVLAEAGAAPAAARVFERFVERTLEPVLRFWEAEARAAEERRGCGGADGDGDGGDGGAGKGGAGDGGAAGAAAGFGAAAAAFGTCRSGVAAAVSAAGASGATVFGAASGTALSVSGYYPVGSEFSPLPLLSLLFGRGCVISLPVVRARRPFDKDELRRSPLEFHEWVPGSATVAGRFNVPVPDPARSRPVTPEVVLVPGVAFDTEGRRLGYGSGCFDAAIARLRARQRRGPGAAAPAPADALAARCPYPPAEVRAGKLQFLKGQFLDDPGDGPPPRLLVVGCAYDRQTRRSLAAAEEPHDQKMDALLTDERVVICQQWLKDVLAAKKWR